MDSKRKNNKIIYIAPSLSSFIKSDISILSKSYYIISNVFSWNKKYFIPFYFIRQIYSILRNINSSIAIFISFGGYWSLIPTLIGKLFNVPVFIILHGTDCASIPLFNYGSLRKWAVRKFCKHSYKNATMLLPVSSSLILIKNTYNTDDISNNQGYKHFFPNINTNTKVVYNGIDSKFWKKKQEIKKEDNSFIAVFSLNQFILKGGDLILEVSKKLSSCNFYIAGCKKPNNLKENYKNVHFLGEISPQNLRLYYNKCQFHLQLSIFEGFGIALCEAMLCECIPIGSSVNIIPEIIGDSGFVLQKRDADKLEKLINKALSYENKEELGNIARKRIIQNYSIEKREKKLLSLIK